MSSLASRINYKDIAARVVKTFLQAALAAVPITAFGSVRNVSGLTTLAYVAGTAGICAVWNLLLGAVGARRAMQLEKLAAGFEQWLATHAAPKPVEQVVSAVVAAAPMVEQTAVPPTITQETPSA